MKAGAWALALVLAGCGAEGVDLGAGDPEPPPDDAMQAARACRADAPTFVLRTLPWLHGRRAVGSTEVRVLAQLVHDLDARDRDGRRVLAHGLAQGQDYRRRWSLELLELLRTRRAGHRALPYCHGDRGPASDTTELARFVLEQPPGEAFHDPSWTMLDLIYSSLRADDLRPVLFADVLTRMAAPVSDANTSPEDLERARRTNFGRSFEAVYLGRRFECLGCHRDDASVTDHLDPALDRFWPVAHGLEQAVYAATEDATHAAFRWEGFGSGGQRPWGSEHCGYISVGHEGDLLGTEAFLGGPLPPGAHAIDVMERLRTGMERLAADGWSDAAPDGEVALAQLVVLHMVDGIWSAATGRRLTLDHGAPRNAAQSDRLRALAVVLVGSDYSLRTLLTEIATDVYADQSVPAACEGEGPEPLPAVFDPFATASPQLGPGANGVGHAVHRRDPLALVDAVHRLWGLPLPGTMTNRSGFDEALLGALGAYLRESEPGHDGLDVVGLLAWERALEALTPATAQPSGQTPPLSLLDLVDAARDDRGAGVGTLMMAIKDRVLAEPVIDANERALIEALVELSWDQPAVDVDRTVLEGAAFRYARVLLASPQFLLTGLERAPSPVAPAMALPATQPAALCSHWGPQILPDEPWTCTNDGLTLP